MNTPSTDRCTVHRLDLRDVARAASDPGLALLLTTGWRVVAFVPVEEEQGPALVLLLAPPVPVPAPPAVQTPSGSTTTGVGILVGVIAFLIGTLLSMVVR